MSKDIIEAETTKIKSYNHPISFLQKKSNSNTNSFTFFLFQSVQTFPVQIFYNYDIKLSFAAIFILIPGRFPFSKKKRGRNKKGRTRGTCPPETALTKPFSISQMLLTARETRPLAVRGIHQVCKLNVW